MTTRRTFLAALAATPALPAVRLDTPTMPDGWAQTDGDPETWTRGDGLSVWRRRGPDWAPVAWAVCVQNTAGGIYPCPEPPTRTIRHLPEFRSAAHGARWLDEALPPDDPAAVAIRDLPNPHDHSWRGADHHLADLGTRILKARWEQQDRHRPTPGA